MPRIEPVHAETATPEQAKNLQHIVGRVTNMKRTLARSREALDALLQWYPLYDAVVPFLGARATSIFCHAISTQSDCLVCSTYFRRELLEEGHDPDLLSLDAREEVIATFGKQLAVDANLVDDGLYEQLATFFSDDQIVVLTAFGTLMIATNIFNNALRVDLDEELYQYRLDLPEAGVA